jgi:pyruvate/2-oxoacid:ferredoxin oxidoreductase beta subunit
LPDDGGLRAARYAVECGAFPIYEVEDGNRYTINHRERTRPVAEYLAVQKRYRGIPDSEIARLQSEIDEGWDWLMRLEGRVEGQFAP